MSRDFLMIPDVDTRPQVFDAVVIQIAQVIRLDEVIVHTAVRLLLAFRFVTIGQAAFSVRSQYFPGLSEVVGVVREVFAVCAEHIALVQGTQGCIQAVVLGHLGDTALADFSGSHEQRLGVGQQGIHSVGDVFGSTPCLAVAVVVLADAPHQVYVSVANVAVAPSELGHSQDVPVFQGCDGGYSVGMPVCAG